MKKTERIVWIVIVFSLLLWSAMSRRGDDGEVGGGNEASTSSSSPGRGRDRSPGDLERPQRDRPASGGSDRSGAGARSLQVLRSEDPLTRLSEFLKVLASSDAGNFEQISAALAELKASGISLPMEEELMNLRAGQLKGAELMAGRTGSAEDFAEIGMLKKQYEGWIQSDPQRAGNWLKGLPAGKFHDQMAVAYIAACTKDDPLGSLNLVSSLHPSQQSAAGRAAAQRLAESASADEASAVFRKLEANAGGADSPYLSTLFDTLVSGERDGRLAVSLVESNLDQPFVTGSTLARVSAERAKTDPEAALAWAVSMEGRKTDVAEGDVVASTIAGMTLDGLESARAWAATQQDGAGYWLDIIERREELLKNRRGEENEYDKDD